MAESGQFPAHVPATLRGAMRAPAMTPAELVDRHNITDPDVRELFVAYLTRRSYDIDYVTLLDLAADLCGKFWTRILQINPDKTDFASHRNTTRAGGPPFRSVGTGNHA